MSIISPDDPIRLLASVPAVTVEPHSTLADLAVRLEDEQIGAVAVSAGDHLEGVVTERDLVRAIAGRSDPADTWAADVMAEDPVTIDGDEPIIVAAELMLDTHVRHLVIVGDGEMLGVVSIRDVLDVLTRTWRRTADPT